MYWELERSEFRYNVIMASVEAGLAVVCAVLFFVLFHAFVNGGSYEALHEITCSSSFDFWNTNIPVRYVVLPIIASVLLVNFMGLMFRAMLRIPVVKYLSFIPYILGIVFWCVATKHVCEYAVWNGMLYVPVCIIFCSIVNLIGSLILHEEDGEENPWIYVIFGLVWVVFPLAMFLQKLLVLVIILYIIGAVCSQNDPVVAVILIFC